MALEIDNINLSGVFSATTISATTIVMGSQTLQQIFAPITPSGYLPLSGGTVTGQTIFNSGISVTNLSGGTILSGNTDLYSIFSTIGSGGGGSTTYVQPGSNITTGGTATSPIINLIASPSVNNITFSGTAIGGTVQAAAVTATSLSATTLSGGTILSGSTNLYSIFATIPDQNDITRVQPGSNITTGGTGNNPIINLTASPSINNLTISGLTSSSDGATFVRLSGTTIFVGNSTTGGTVQAEKELILQQTGDTFGSSILRLRNRTGENGAIYETTDPTITLVDFIFKTAVNQRNVRYESRTGSAFLTAPEFQFGVAANPALVIDDTTVLVRGSNGIRTTSLSATTFSGGTIFSGNTNIQNYFNTINAQLATKANDSGDTFTGQVNATILSATTLSATSVFTNGFRLPVSPVAGYMLTSDANGNASWQASPVSGSGTTKLDMQSISTATTTTATSTLVDVPGMVLTAKNLGSSATTYLINFNGQFSNNNNSGVSALRVTLNGNQIPGSPLVAFTNMGASMATATRTISLSCKATGITNGDVIKIQMSASTGTLTAQAGKTLSILGTLNANLV